MTLPPEISALSGECGLKQLPQTVGLHLIDVREVTPPSGSEPVHWRLLTSPHVSDIGTARKMIGFYRKRWIIEEFFRTLKSAGFQIEDADIGDPKVMVKFAALAVIAAVTVIQLLKARDNPSGQACAIPSIPRTSWSFLPSAESSKTTLRRNAKSTRIRRIA